MTQQKTITFCVLFFKFLVFFLAKLINPTPNRIKYPKKHPFQERPPSSSMLQVLEKSPSFFVRKHIITLSFECDDQSKLINTIEYEGKKQKKNL